MKLNYALFVISLLIVLMSGVVASGQCFPGDGNDTKDDATTIGYLKVLKCQAR